MSSLCDLCGVHWVRRRGQMCRECTRLISWVCGKLDAKVIS